MYTDYLEDPLSFQKKAPKEGVILFEIKTKIVEAESRVLTQFNVQILPAGWVVAILKKLIEGEGRF